MESDLILGEATTVSRLVRKEFASGEELGDFLEQEGPAHFDYVSVEFEDVDGQRIWRLEFIPSLVG